MTGRTTLRGRLAAAAAGMVALTLGNAAPAGALPVLDATDATELAEALAEATDDQNVCYGWKVAVYDYSGGADGIDQGSSLGVGQTAVRTECPRYVVFEASITYTSPASESEDSARFDVVSNIPGAPTAVDLRDNGISVGALLGAEDDEVVANATLLLPALMAEKGLVEPISLEANTEPLPAGDRPTGTPGSDWLRKYGAAVAVAALILIGGLGWAAWIVFREYPFTRASVPTTSRRKRSGGLHQ